MKKVRIAIAAMMLAAAAHADDFASAKDAQTMVGKAVKEIKTAGSEKAYAKFTGKDPAFIDRDIYVVVYDMSGTVLAHGQNAKMVGKNLIDLKDADGKAFVKERVDMAHLKDSFWQEYKFTDPVTKKVLPKSSYCERADQTVVCAGVYKR